MIRFGILVCLVAAALSAASPFCNDCAVTRRELRGLCDYIAQNKRDMPTIFVAGYYMRTLVAGYQILGDRRYLDIALAHGDALLAKQMPNGYWGTGYGNIYLADTANALGEILALDKHADPARRAKYFAALKRLVEAIERDKLIRPSGALGTGFRAKPDGTILRLYEDDYTVSSALVGGETLIWMYAKTHEEKYRQWGWNAVNWVLGTIREDGVIPYILPGEYADPRVKGDPENDFNLWERLRYTNVTYVGEGILSFDLHCGKPVWQAELRRKFKPVIEFVLRTQNADGSWGNTKPMLRPDSNRSPWNKRPFPDRRRSAGAVNVLTWWYNHVEKDPRALAAVRKFDRYITNPANAADFGMLHRCPPAATATPQPLHTDEDVATALTGRAIADILMPGVDSSW
ncbi:MAG: hypothetical protein LLG20_14650 [Acidobacteriales bacterium]|nr:hypothetical protein [Terriglobales bacterium]